MARSNRVTPTRTRSGTWRVRAMCDGEVLIDRTFDSYENAARAARWADRRRAERLGTATTTSLATNTVFMSSTARLISNNATTPALRLSAFQATLLATVMKLCRS